ncbi:hypothetical protein PC9H_009381 [Pleurotus ostreatus]|uniref:HD/PDEase domain-containing protein n=3 Tax=Pleurotus TaxID=5320 RepID=A0A067N950_PLEO1|nr:uncharacterized protein PC9H_009381 [Pleurotus ostreatus]KAF7424080.1 hypothetical protein PC9H_009381 [Pleurotus ostreatus]KAG9224541.1 hypothetical protein CCMSSC00406_0002308 [Pleurotus cornucopiae]KAJ8693099.1 hypothetical protein PTI98_010345 [Pleurotus ostreatus]KDQ24334.1 hypothetical protein PLEOSDRAFT_52552 [Pleurotus ostreatus PC15]
MYPSSIEQKIIDEAEKLMVETMSRYDASHDAFHVRRVRKTALALANSVTSSSPTKPDLLVVELAALLHDVLDKKYVSPEQASDPYAYFLPFFQSTLAVQDELDLIADGRARLITRIIDNISWKTEQALREKGLVTDWHRECVELHCVQDADRLDAIGAFGILRCAAYNAVTNHVLHAPAEDPANDTSAIQHFHDKLLHISEQLKTEPGKRMGRKRHQMLVGFLEAIDEEYAGSLPAA